jgi:NTP pyrophosphatase (non-canonical NTP hydrolase)
MRELQREVRAFCRERGWDHGTPANYAKSICIEAAELLELFQWNDFDESEVVANIELTNDVQSELADVLIYCLDLASLLNLNVSTIVREKLRATKEKYPVKQVKGNRAAYFRIKANHRKLQKK